MPAANGGPPARPDRVLDARGMYLLPGFVDMHGHCGGKPKVPEAEYVYKLWMAHGVTTSRGVGHGPMMWALAEQATAAYLEIVAARALAPELPLHAHA